MRVFVPGPLRSYTEGASRVDASGGTLDELLAELNDRFPGFRFRIIDEQDQVREHIKIFVNGDQHFDLSSGLEPTDEIHVICALSGGSGEGGRENDQWSVVNGQC